MTQAAQQPPGQQEATPPWRVLVVDDDAFTLELLSDMLDTLGRFEIRTEQDARRALKTLGQHPPDLLICDLAMPELDGIEFLGAAAESAYRGGVLLLSGVDSGVRQAAERLAQAQGLRMLGAYRKPLALDELRAALVQLGAPGVR